MLRNKAACRIKMKMTSCPNCRLSQILRNSEQQRVRWATKLEGEVRQLD